jgi:thiamine pyrophosphate-dependent acetolactate synthase large subunit-like protein
MGTLRGEQIIAQSFKREGVDTIFFMMGGPTGGTAGACIDLGMKGIYVRHEQAAAMMAHAYARVTGKPGICIAPMGPGVANLVTGLGNAWADATPVIAIGGAAPMRGTTLDTFQEMDQIPMIEFPSTSASRFAKRSTASAGRFTSICRATSWPVKSKKKRFIG